jgi:hypothetical protein
MIAQDMTIVSRKATCETEVFINCYLDDQAKGWPMMRPTQVKMPNAIEHWALRVRRDLNVFEKTGETPP